MGHVLQEEYLYHGNCKCCKSGHLLWWCAVVGGFLRGSLPAPHPAPPLPHFPSGNASLGQLSALCHHPAPKFWKVSLTLTFQIQLCFLGNLSWDIFRHIPPSSETDPASRTRKAVGGNEGWAKRDEKECASQWKKERSGEDLRGMCSKETS